MPSTKPSASTTPLSQSLPRTIPTGDLCGDKRSPGTTVSTQACAFQLDPAFYPDPLCFNSDRWLKPTKAMKGAFFAWGACSRGCMGTHIARLELTHATCMFFRECEDRADNDEISSSFLRMATSVRLR